MHPAPSVIIFTTLSGLGFGLLFFLGLGMPDVSGVVAFVFYGIAFGLSVGGLAASTFHLGHPERAWRAFTQWRTSWLSREGVCAIAALLVMGLFAIGAIFLDRHWAGLGIVGSALSLATVFATSMIYTQLKTIPRWNMKLTPAMFLSFSLAGGALLAGQVSVALPLLAIAALVQLAYWRHGDRAFATSGTDLGTATGLGDRGKVRSMAHPHSSPNYLMRELIHVVGRKHAQKLRVIAFGLGFAVPLALLLIPFESTALKHLVAGLAALAHLAGVAASRWLFFAQAEHTVGLYYGMR